MRFILICLFISFATYSADAKTVGKCDIENHSGQDAECWDTYDIIQEMGNLGHHLVHEAKCKEIIDAIHTVGTAQSPRQLMLNISFVTYSSGFAAGALKPADFMQVEMLTFCSKNPSAKLRDF